MAGAVEGEIVSDRLAGQVPDSNHESVLARFATLSSDGDNKEREIGRVCQNSEQRRGLGLLGGMIETKKEDLRPPKLD